MSRTVLIISLAFFGCSRSLPPLLEGLASLTPTRPQLPLSAADSVLSLALEQALLHGIPDFAPRPRAAVIQSGGLASAHVLPRLNSVTFYILDSAQIQTLVDPDGDMPYLLVGHVTMEGDSATASIRCRFALRRAPGRDAGGIGIGGGGCFWILRRHDGHWQIGRLGGCLVS
jgi:hypothetical protein